MVTESQMYWLTRLDSVKSLATPAGFFLFFSLLGLVIMIGLSIASAVQATDPSEKTQKDSVEMKAVAKGMRWPVCIILAISLIICVGNLFVPTSKEYAAIKVIPAVLNNTVLSQQVKEDFGDFYSLATEWAKDELREATGTVKQEAKEAVEKAVEKVTEE